MDFAGLSIHLQRQELHKGHKIRLSAPTRHGHFAMARFGFHRHKQIAGSGPLVLVIFFGHLPRNRWNWPPGLLQKLFALFIQTNHWLGGIVRFGIKPQQVIHSLSVFGGNSPDAPHHFLPRFTDVFFRICRMLSRLMAWSLGRCPAAIVNERIVQRACPSGGWLHAKATTSASWSVPYLAGWPGRAAS